MVALVPAAAPGAGSLLETCLSEIEDTEFKIRGIQVGKEAALAVMTTGKQIRCSGFSRGSRGRNPVKYPSTMPYAVSNGVWPNNAVYAPNLGTFRPFGIERGDQFRVAPPYEVNSPEYAADFEEVKVLGGNTSTVRTQEESDLAVFFLTNISNFMNHIAPNPVCSGRT